MMPGQAPQPGMMTPTPAAAPSANLGAEAHAAAQVKQALIMLEMALPKLGIQSPLHGAVLTSVKALAKHLPATGGNDQGIQASMLRDLALRQQQQSPMVAAMQARGGPPGAPPGAAPGGMPEPQPGA